MITIIHDDGTELNADEIQTCQECNGKYDLSRLIISYDKGYYDAAYVECPHCQNETIIYTY